MNLTKFLCTAPKKIVFLYQKLLNKGTTDEYDDMFTSGCNWIVCLNRRAESKAAECGAYT